MGVLALADPPGGLGSRPSSNVLEVGPSGLHKAAALADRLSRLPASGWKAASGLGKPAGEGMLGHSFANGVGGCGEVPPGERCYVGGDEIADGVDRDDQGVAGDEDE